MSRIQKYYQRESMRKIKYIVNLERAGYIMLGVWEIQKIQIAKKLGFASLELLNSWNYYFLINCC